MVHRHRPAHGIITFVHFPVLKMNSLFKLNEQKKKWCPAKDCVLAGHCIKNVQIIVTCVPFHCVPAQIARSRAVPVCNLNVSAFAWKILFRSGEQKLLNYNEGDIEQMSEQIADGSMSLSESDESNIVTRTTQTSS